MTTTTSYSDHARFKALYRNAFRRSMGYFGLLSVLLLIFYPFQYAMKVFRELSESQLVQLAQGTNIMQLFNLVGMGRQFTAVSAIFYTIIVLVAPFVLALVLNSYMHSKNAADVYHSLPVRRETLLGVNTAVAMTIITIPVLACNLLVILMQTIKFGFHPFLAGQILIDTAGWLICALFIYALTTAVCTLVGTVFDSFTFSGILMAALPILMAIYSLLASMFLFGFEPSQNFLQTLLDVCPLTLMPARMAFTNIVTPNGFSFLSAENATLLLRSNLAIAIYLVLSVALLFGAMRLYRHRGSETAETTTSKGILQTLVKLLGTTIGGIFIGMMFYAVNAEDGATAKMPFVMWSIIGGILTYSIIEIILNRGFKSLVKSLPLGVGMVAVVTVSTLSILLGGFGYENRIPDAASVESVEINYMGRFSDYGNILSAEKKEGTSQPMHSIQSVTLSDPDNVAAILDYHQDVVNVKFRPDRNNAERRDIIYSNTNITYHLKNGKVFRRSYNAVTGDSFVKLAPLETSAEFLAQTQPAFFTNPENVTRWTIADPFGTQKIEKIFSAEESAAMLDAIKADLLAQTFDSLLSPTDQFLAVISFDADVPEEGSERCATSGYFYVTSEQQSTWKILNQMGLADQLKPDFSKCTAVVADAPDSIRLYNSSRSAVYQVIPMQSFRFEDLEGIRQEIANQKSYKEDYVSEYNDYEGYAYTKEYGGNLHLFENPALISQMAQNVVATGAINEPMVNLRFFFEDSADGTMVAVPLNKLPQEVQLELQSDVPEK